MEPSSRRDPDESVEDLLGELLDAHLEVMTFFFLVIGLDARREFDLGELREVAPAVGEETRQTVVL